MQCEISNVKPKNIVKKCEHGKRKVYCKNCGGGSICEHNKRKSRCKECGGSEFCEHNKRKSRCKECGGSEFCEHGRIKSTCKECGGSQICEHDKMKAQCRECSSGKFCEHNRKKTRCKDCGGSEFCEHNKRKSTCKECGGSQICEHGRIKSTCKECGGSQICEHGRIKSKCKECGGSQICEHNKRKSECRQCGGSQICIHKIRKTRCRDCDGRDLCNNKEGLCTQHGNKKYNNYCTHCFSHLFPDDPLTKNIRLKTKELQIRDFINENYDGFIHDKAIFLGDGCDCTNKRRIDFRKIIDNTMLAIEVDEFQHKRYNKKDEEARYNDMTMVFTGKWYYIRYNPDTYKDANEIRQDTDMKTRLNKLQNTIDEAIYEITNEKNEEFIKFKYLYYDEK